MGVWIGVSMVGGGPRKETCKANSEEREKQ